MFTPANMAGWHGRLGTMLHYGLAGSPTHWSDRVGETKQSMVEQAAISVIELLPRLTISVCRGHGSPPQCEAAQHVVGEREPQHGAGLICAAHRQPGEPDTARPGI